MKTLVGQGGGTIGVTDSGRKLTEYILDAVQDQFQAENGKPISVYPVEVLADRFEQDLERYRKDLSKFLKDPKFFDEEEQEEHHGAFFHRIYPSPVANVFTSGPTHQAENTECPGIPHSGTMNDQS